MKERRSKHRMPAKVPVRFRIVREGTDTRVSETVMATMRDLSMAGLAMETSCIEADGLHVSYNEHPALKNRLYLQWKLPKGRSLKAVGETVWYERAVTAESSFVVGLRFLDISREDRKALSDFLASSEGERPLSL